ncbi:MAG: hypothetical protein ACK4YP_04850 [Myxococcota bacterium]
MDAPLPYVLAVVALLGAVVGAVVFARLRRWVRAVQLRAKMRRARRREALAEGLLRDAGYDVVATQVTAPCPLLHDGEAYAPDVRADYLVERRGRLYVAEAKSGPRATDPTERATRRQLLEYAVTYDVDGVLLVDTEEGTVSTVEFPALRRTAGPGFWGGVIVGAGIVSVLVLVAA